MHRHLFFPCHLLPVSLFSALLHHSFALLSPTTLSCLVVTTCPTWPCCNRLALLSLLALHTTMLYCDHLPYCNHRHSVSQTCSTVYHMSLLPNITAYRTPPITLLHNNGQVAMYVHKVVQTSLQYQSEVHVRSAVEDVK
jgi:hypothetical protein